jgi:hypothetical protein
MSSETSGDNATNSYDDPIFKNVDATYIIHLEGNGRLEHIKEQLSRFHPSKIVYILFNKGYKKCKKDPRITIPQLDIVDAFYQCFKHAHRKNYENILILEDDFIFDEKILDPQHSRRIDEFVLEKNKREENFVYYLGAVSYLQTAFGEYHNRLFLSSGAQSCIYPKAFMKYMLENVKQERITDWDIYLNFNYVRYKYYTSLCYQTSPETENGKNFRDDLYTGEVLKYIAKILSLETQPQPGFDIMESTSKFMFWFMMITFILLMYLFFNTISLLYMVFTGKIKNRMIKKYSTYILLILLLMFILYPLVAIGIFFLSIHIQKLFYTF